MVQHTHSNWRPEPLNLVCEQPISTVKENNISADVTLMMLNPHTFRATECRREPHMPATAGVESIYKFRRRKHDWYLQDMFCKVFGEEGKKSLGFTQQIFSCGIYKNRPSCLLVLTLVCTNWKLGTSLQNIYKWVIHSFFYASAMTGSTDIHIVHPYYSFVVATLTCNEKALVHMSMSVQIYSCRCHPWGCWSLLCGCSLLRCGRWLSGEKSSIMKSSMSLWRWWRPQSQICSAQSSGADCFSGWERKWVSGLHVRLGYEAWWVEDSRARILL